MNQRIGVVTFLFLLFAGSVAIYLLIWFTQLRLKNTIIEETPLPKVRQHISSPPPLTSNSEAPQTVAKNNDTYSLQRLVRGNVLELDSKNLLLTVVRENFSANGKEESSLINLNLAGIKTVTCWPENITTVEGNRTSIKEAYFPLEENSELYLVNQTQKDIANVLFHLTTSKPYVFALLKDTSYTQEKNDISQLVVLNCP